IQEGIDHHWENAASPLEKYMLLTNPARLDEAKDWEHWNHGTGVDELQNWFGHCQGWVAAAILNAPVKHGVRARVRSGRVEPCASGTAGCVEFMVGDLTGLAAEAYLDAPIKAIGARCDRASEELFPDLFGRVPRDGSGCKGLNPGALAAVL